MDPDDYSQLEADSQYFKSVLSNLIPAVYFNIGDGSPSSIGGACAKGLDDGSTEVSLRDRLHQKIEELKGKRSKPGKVAESLEKKRLKRKLSKAKLRQRRKAEKQKLTEKSDIGRSKTSKTSPVSTKPVFNKEGNIVFSKFDFANGGGQKSAKKSDVPTGKNYKSLLDRVQKQKDKLAQTKQSDPKKAQVLEDKIKWKMILAKAEGVKVQDNPELLKKSIKKKEKKKEHSRKKWEEREKKLGQQMKQRQDKRAKNIAKKKEGRKEKKIKSARKRGRMID